MSKVITFSRVFPSYHPKKGEPTYFLQKIWEAIDVPLPVSDDAEKLESEVGLLMRTDFKSKYHTIRNGNRFKEGEFFSPRCWEGKPYKSKMLKIADDIKIEKVFIIEIFKGSFYIDGRHFTDIKKLAQNDGLTEQELLDWFQYPKNFSGQIICWNKDIQY